MSSGAIEIYSAYDRPIVYFATGRPMVSSVPEALSADQFGLEQATDGRGQGAVETVTPWNRPIRSPALASRSVYQVARYLTPLPLRLTAGAATMARYVTGGRSALRQTNGWAVRTMVHRTRVCDVAMRITGNAEDLDYRAGAGAYDNSCDVRALMDSGTGM